MPETVELNDLSRRIHVVGGPETQRAEILDALADAVKQRPDIGTWDCIADLRHSPTGDIVFNLSSLVPFFDREISRPALTVLVTEQPRMDSWVLLLNHLFKSRRFCVASSVREADRLLENGNERFGRSLS